MIRSMKSSTTACSGPCRPRLLLTLLLGVVVLLVVVVVPTATAFSTFPGGCPAGESGTTTGHPVLNPVPTFAQLGYNLLVNGQAVVASTTLQVGQRYEVAVQATGEAFRGALIRVTGQGLVEAGQNSALAPFCTVAPGGVGHVDGNPKRILSGFLTVTAGTSVTLDVTVVESYEAGDSNVYTYQAFRLAVAADTAPAPTPAPTTLAGRPASFWAAIIALIRLLPSILFGIGR
jgi:hypothetical protein